MRMKRFRRWIFNGLAALSLLLCVATLGVLSVDLIEYARTPIEDPDLHIPAVEIGLYFLIPVVFGSLAAMFWRARSGGRTGAGCCPVCGYDLRATPDRCQEYGTIPAKPPTIST
jgi:hypothetical protein